MDLRVRGIGMSYGGEGNRDDNDRGKGCILSLPLTRLEFSILSQISVGSTKIRIESCGSVEVVYGPWRCAYAVIWSAACNA